MGAPWNIQQLARQLQKASHGCNGYICFQYLHTKTSYSKCPKISYTKISYRMEYANSADPDQTAPEGAVWPGSTLFVIPLSI